MVFRKPSCWEQPDLPFTWSRVLGVTAVYRSWSRLFQTLPNKRGRGRWPSKGLVGLVGLVGTERWECCFISIKKSAYSSFRTNSPVRSDPGSIPPSVNCLNCPRGCALQQAMPEQAHYFFLERGPFASWSWLSQAFALGYVKLALLKAYLPPPPWL